MRKWARRSLVGVFVVVIVCAAASTIYHHVERTKLFAQFPPPGKLVDIGGRRIQLDCRGHGTPIVVFEAGRDLNGSLSWYRVHDDVAAFTRACAYSRAGILWSDPKSSPPTAKAAADDLHEVLARAGERGPFVLAGHSAGGPAILVYTKYYPEEVAGLVFVDASHPQQFERLAAAVGMQRPALGWTARVTRTFAWTGVVRLWTPVPPQNDSEAMKIVSAFSPYSWVGATREIDEDDDWFGEAGTVHSLGSRPVFVLSGMKPSADRLGISPQQEMIRLQLWRTMQDELAALSTHSRHEEDVESDHYVQMARPAHVVSAVKWVVDAVSEVATPQP